MGGRTISPESKTNPYAPGPGAYESNKRFSVASLRFGNGDRSDFTAQFKTNPGPGQYKETNLHLKSAPNIGFGSQER